LSVWERKLLRRGRRGGGVEDGVTVDVGVGEGVGVDEGEEDGVCDDDTFALVVSSSDEAALGANPSLDKGPSMIVSLIICSS
jgi:hypothetical protein